VYGLRRGFDPGKVSTASDKLRAFERATRFSDQTCAAMSAHGDSLPVAAGHGLDVSPDPQEKT
jgi:hypothetical protein